PDPAPPRRLACRGRAARTRLRPADPAPFSGPDGPARRPARDFAECPSRRSPRAPSSTPTAPLRRQRTTWRERSSSRQVLLDRKLANADQLRSGRYVADGSFVLGDEGDDALVGLELRRRHVPSRKDPLLPIAANGTHA